MSYRNELDSFIARLQQRLRLGAWLRGAAIFTGTALAVTVALVLVLNQLAFPAQDITLSRVFIFLALAAAAAFGIALPVVRLTRAQAVRRAEIASPALGQRLTTYRERAARDSTPFLELLAADTLAHAQDAEPAVLVPEKRLFALGGAGLACIAVLVWMIAAGPGYLGYGASLLWTGPKTNAAPLYAISVAPGNVTVRRNSDQLVTARVTGMQPSSAQLLAHYQSAAGWEPVAMQRAPAVGSGAAYQFVLAGLPEDVEYYVSAGPLTSPHYKVRVVDLPSIKDIHVTYHYPAWTGMNPVAEEHSGDLRAIEGTDAEIEIRTDRPLTNGQLTRDDGRTVQLAGGSANTYRGSIHMAKDGAYHLTASEEGQPVRLSEDFFIATDKALPPEIAIARPAGDYRASPIEEVTVGVKGADAFGLAEMHLHYSVNGGPDRDVNLLKKPGEKSADGSFTLPLEDFKLEPGDLVSVYATAKDGHSESRTDISFIQVDPFEREFSQSQQSGGGAGGGNAGDQTEISKREKELIAATWKQQNNKAASASSTAAQGEFLSEAQRKLRDQVNALQVRMQSRDISEANQEFTNFDKDMRDAAASMAPAADKLNATDWKDAIPLEQKALQALLRAEATFRKIEVAFGQRGGGGGGNAGRDLASLFDLELDTAKNQYETAQNASPAEQHAKDLEDTLAKLDALAKRQEELANPQQSPQQSFEQRWQQEMLRREAEQLQRQMEQLARNGQQGGAQSESQSGVQSGSQSAQANGSQGSSSPSNAGASASSGQAGSASQSRSVSARQQADNRSSDASSGQSGDPSNDERIEQAIDRMRRATSAMRRSDNPGDNSNAQHAAEALHEASNLLAGTQHQLATGKVDAMAREADRLRQDENAQAGRINKFANEQNPVNVNDLDALMARRRELSDLARQRQALSDGVSSLEKNLRDAAREMAPNQPGVAKDLRDALSEMDNSDLDNRVQRSADWLRRGIDPNSNGTEDQIAQGLAKLSQQLHQAQQGMGIEKDGRQGARQNAGEDQQALLDQVERLRSQIDAMARRTGNGDQSPQNGQRGQTGRDGQYSSDASRLSRDGQPGDQHGQEDRRGSSASGQLGQNQLAQSGGNGGRASGDLGGTARGSASGGEVRNGGGGATDGTVWNNINTGDNRYAHPRQGPAPAGPSANPADTEHDFLQGMRELSQLREMVKDDPQAAQDVAALARQMQRLDPSRFPGNPAMVEQMHREVLSSVDRLELEFERGGISPEARTGNAFAIPDGYRDSVADYYKRLSRNQ